MATLSYTNVTGGFQVPANVQFYYDRNLLENAKEQLFWGKFGTNKVLRKKNGKEIRFSMYKHIPVALDASGNLTDVLAEGAGAVNAKQIEKITISATMVRFGAHATYSDEVDLYHEDPVITILTDELGQHAGLTVDTYYGQVFSGGSNVVYADASTGVGGSTSDDIAPGDIVNDKALNKVGKALRMSLAKKFTSRIGTANKYGSEPLRPAYYMGVHPDVRDDLENVPGYVSAEKYASFAQLAPNEVGARKELRFLETTRIETLTNANATPTVVYKNIAFGKDAFGIVNISGKKKIRTIIKPTSAGGAENPYNTKGSVAWVADTSALILNQYYVCRLECAATENTTVAGSNPNVYGA